MRISDLHWWHVGRSESLSIVKYLFSERGVIVLEGEIRIVAGSYFCNERRVLQSYEEYSQRPVYTHKVTFLNLKNFFYHTVKPNYVFINQWREWGWQNRECKINFAVFNDDQCRWRSFVDKATNSRDKSYTRR